jgi:hypothetical protein
MYFLRAKTSAHEAIPEVLESPYACTFWNFPFYFHVRLFPHVYGAIHSFFGIFSTPFESGAVQPFFFLVPGFLISCILSSLHALSRVRGVLGYL